MKRYKYLIFALLIGAVAGAMLAPSVAGAIGSAVGVIDLEKAVTSHPSYESKLASFKTYKDEQDARLDAYRNKEVLTEEDKEAIVNLRIEIDNAVAEKYEMLFGPVEDDVVNAVEKVGMESGIEVIIDSKAVLYGGLDLTAAVINELGRR